MTEVQVPHMIWHASSRWWFRGSKELWSQNLGAGRIQQRQKNRMLGRAVGRREGARPRELGGLPFYDERKGGGKRLSALLGSPVSSSSRLGREFSVPTVKPGLSWH